MLRFLQTLLCSLLAISCADKTRSVEFCGQSLSVGATTVECHDRSVTDLAPLAEFEKLTHLVVSNTNVSDLRPLEVLAKLEVLDANNTRVSDLAPLLGHTKLKQLDLNRTRVSDFTPLAKLEALEWLFLANTEVVDLQPLANLVNLKILILADTDVSDLAPLANLARLGHLNLNGTKVSDLAPLTKLEAVWWLRVARTGVTDLGPMADATRLNRLDIRDTGVSDLAPIQSAIRFRELEAQRSDVPPTQINALHSTNKKLKISHDANRFCALSGRHHSSSFPGTAPTTATPSRATQLLGLLTPLGLLALGWLLAFVALRRSPLPRNFAATLDAWSVPQLLAVGAFLVAILLAAPVAVVSGASLSVARSTRRRTVV